MGKIAKIDFCLDLNFCILSSCCTSLTYDKRRLPYKTGRICVHAYRKVGSDPPVGQSDSNAKVLLYAVIEWLKQLFLLHN